MQAQQYDMAYAFTNTRQTTQIARNNCVSGLQTHIRIRLDDYADYKGDSTKDTVTTLPVLQKPPMGAECNRCGVCCQREACGLSREFLQSDTAPCVALEIEENGQFRCGLIHRPSHYLGTFPEGDEMFRNGFRLLLGIGRGCDSSDD